MTPRIPPTVAMPTSCPRQQSSKRSFALRPQKPRTSASAMHQPAQRASSGSKHADPTDDLRREKRSDDEGCHTYNLSESLSPSMDECDESRPR